MPAPDLESFKVAADELSSATKFNNLVQAIEDEFSDVDPDQISGYPSDATKFLRGDGAWAVPWVEVVKAADESVTSSTVLQDDDHLFFAAAAGVTYLVEAVLIYKGGAGSTGPTPAVKLAAGEDATNRGNLNVLFVSTTDAGSSSQFLSDQTSTVVLGTNPIQRIAILQGVHVGNGGTFRIKWAQNASSAIAATMIAKSFLRYRAIV